MSTKRLIWLMGLLLIVATTHGQLSVDYRAGVSVGAIMPDGKAYKSAGMDKDGWIAPTMGANLSVTFRPDWKALKAWNNAGWGVGLGYWNMAGKERLGNAITAYTYLDVALVRCPHFELGLRPGIGAAWMTKTYRNTIPDGHQFLDLTDANQSIGSVTNLYFPEQLYLNFPIVQGWAVGMSMGWYHMSNGSIRQPNSGYNIFAGELMATYTPTADTRDRSMMHGKATYTKAWEIEVAGTAGGRQVYYRDQQTFAVAEIQAAAYWRCHDVFRLGAGVDVYYDGAYIPRETKFGKTDLSQAKADGSDCWRLGISIQPDFVIGRFTAGLHVGAYMLDPVKRMEGRGDDTSIFYAYDLLKAGSAGNPDGWLYTELVLRYRLPWHMLIQASMKSHLTKVEFVSMGLGIWI